MRTPEGKVKDDVKKLLHARGVWFYMPVQMGFGVGGIPDFICCYRGMFVAVECKAPGKRNATTPQQRACMSAIREHGGRVTVVSSADELGLWLSLLDSMYGESDGRPS